MLKVGYYVIFHFQVAFAQLDLLMALANSTAPVKDGLHPFHGGKHFD